MTLNDHCWLISDMKFNSNPQNFTRLQTPKSTAHRHIHYPTKEIHKSVNSSRSLFIKLFSVVYYQVMVNYQHVRDLLTTNIYTTAVSIFGEKRAQNWFRVEVKYLVMKAESTNHLNKGPGCKEICWPGSSRKPGVKKVQDVVLFPFLTDLCKYTNAIQSRDTKKGVCS